LPKFGIVPRFATLDELASIDRVFSGATKLVWFESPINPTLRCVDAAAIAAACRARGVISVIDNTFATPVNQRPISLGVDIVMHSATKYLNGHSDVTAGALAGPDRLIEPIEKARRLVGGVLDPYAAYALGRGLKTLDVRMQRHNENAMAVARWLARDSRVAQVYYPGLESHPDHALARKQMRAFGGMVCLDLGGSFERATHFFDRLGLIKRAASLGGVESLCSLPVLTSQWGHTPEELERAGVTRGMARISIGLEDPNDLIADLDQALE
jgi:cystathionine beta-lyase/cystathionine gamma-synthase